MTFSLSGSFQHQCVSEKRWKAVLSDLAALGLCAAGWGSGFLRNFLATCGSHRLVGLGLEKPWAARCLLLLQLFWIVLGVDVSLQSLGGRIHSTIPRDLLYLSVQASCGNPPSPFILFCVSRPCGWPRVPRAAMDPSCKGNCFQSQRRCWLPLEKCEYPGEIHGADTLGHTVCWHHQQAWYRQRCFAFGVKLW